MMYRDTLKTLYVQILKFQAGSISVGGEPRSDYE